MRTCARSNCCSHTDPFSRYDEYGFERPDDFDYDEYDEFMSVYLTVLSERSMKWSRLMATNGQLKKNGRLKRYVRGGVPISLRARVSRTAVRYRSVVGPS